MKVTFSSERVTFCHISPITGNRGTPATTPFVPTPPGSCQEDVPPLSVRIAGIGAQAAMKPRIGNLGLSWKLDQHKFRSQFDSEFRAQEVKSATRRASFGAEFRTRPRPRRLRIRLILMLCFIIMILIVIIIIMIIIMMIITIIIMIVQ